jgi:putative transposase
MQYERDYWPHAPLHKLTESGVYFVTAATHGRKHHFSGAVRLGVLCRGLLTVCRDASWRLEAWAIFSNHYHFVAQAPPSGAESLRDIIRRLHARTANWVNQVDQSEGRQVWHNFWETQLTFEKSYLARLQYVHENPVKHGLVADARQYPHCSARWLEEVATPAQVRTVRSFRTNTVQVYDDYQTSPDW